MDFIILIIKNQSVVLQSLTLINHIGEIKSERLGAQALAPDMLVQISDPT